MAAASAISPVTSTSGAGASVAEESCSPVVSEDGEQANRLHAMMNVSGLMAPDCRYGTSIAATGVRTPHGFRVALPFRTCGSGGPFCSAGSIGSSGRIRLLARAARRSWLSAAVKL